MEEAETAKKASKVFMKTFWAAQTLLQSCSEPDHLFKHAHGAGDRVSTNRMLPDGQDFPPQELEFPDISPVPGPVRGNLRSPKVDVGLGYRAMRGAKMPKASVDKHDESFSRKHKIGLD